MRRWALILWIPSIMLLFLPYTSRLSPWALVTSSSWSSYNPRALLGLPFLLSFPILIAQARLLFRKPFPKCERATYWTLSYGALAAGMVYPGLGVWNEGFSRGVLKLCVLWTAPCGAALLIMVLSARKLKPDEAATTALQAAWLPNAAVCGIFFWRREYSGTGWEIGAYLAAFTIVLYVLQIGRAIFRKR